MSSHVYKGLAIAVCRANEVMEKRGMVAKLAVHQVTKDGNTRQLACMMMVGAPRDAVAWAYLYCTSRNIEWEQGE